MKAAFNTGLPSPLTDSFNGIPWCLVPVGGKPLIEYWIEWAAELDAHDIRIVLGDGAHEIESFCGDGSRWGLKITYAFLKNTSDPEAYLRRNPEQWKDGLLYITAPVFPRRLKSQDTESEQNNPSGITEKVSWVFQNPDGGTTCFISRNMADIEKLIKGIHAGGSGNWNDLGMEPVLIADTAKYHELNMLMVRGEIVRYVPPGFGGGDGAYIGSNVVIPPSVEMHPPLIIGNNCRIHPMAVIGPDAVIGNNVIVDRQTVLAGSVVIDNTYLGSNLEIKDRVVCGSRLITPTDETMVDIDDPWLLAPLGVTARAVDLPRAVFGWFGAVILTLMQAIPFAVLYSLLRLNRIGRYQFSRRSITHSRVRNLPYWNVTGETSMLNAVFTGLSLDLFPLIALAAAGQLWLCGHAPLHPERDTDLRSQLRHYYPAAIGYHSLNIAGYDLSTATSEALYYQRYRSLFEDIRIIVRVLLNRLLMLLS